MQVLVKLSDGRKIPMEENLARVAKRSWDPGLEIIKRVSEPRPAITHNEVEEIPIKVIKPAKPQVEKVEVKVIEPVFEETKPVKEAEIEESLFDTYTYTVSRFRENIDMFTPEQLQAFAEDSRKTISNEAKKLLKQKENE